MLLVGVASSDPSEVTIVFFLEQKAAYPEILCYATLRVESDLLLLEVDAALCLLEDGESSERRCVILGNLQSFNFFFLFFRFFWLLFDIFGWVDRAGG